MIALCMFAEGFFCFPKGGCEVIHLQKVGAEHGKELFEMRKRAFLPLLERYQDYDTNPAAESWEKFQRFFLESSDNYLICLGELPVGALRVVQLAEGEYRLSPISVLPEYRATVMPNRPSEKWKSCIPRQKAGAWTRSSRSPS